MIEEKTANESEPAFTVGEVRSPVNEKVRMKAIAKAAEVYRKSQRFPLDKMKAAIEAYEATIKKSQTKKDVK